MVSTADGHFTAVRALAAALGCLAAVLHGVFSVVPLPVQYNQLACVWLGLSLAAAAALARAPSGAPRAAYLAFAAGATLLMGILYAVDGNAPLTVWCFVHAALASAMAWLGRRAHAFPRAPAAEASEDGVPAKIEAPPVPHRRCAVCCLRTSLVLHVLLLLLLLLGASVAFAAAVGFPPRGPLTRVTLPGGEALRLHYRCVDGAEGVPSRSPTLWITSSPGHGVADLSGLQESLAGRGFRACAYDPPGFGWSDRDRGSGLDQADVAAALLAEVQGPDPLAFVAWGGGASTAVRLANRLGAGAVRAVVLITAFPEGIEFDEAQRAQGLTEAERRALEVAAYRSRAGLAQGILAVLLPWGLAPAVFPPGPPPPGFRPQSRFPDARAQLWKGKFWAQQYWGIRRQAALAAAGGATDPDLTAPVPVGHLLCKPTGDGPCQRPDGSIVPPDECAQRKDRAAYLYQRQVAFTRALDAKAVFEEDTDPACNLGLPVDMPVVAARGVARLLTRVG